LQLPIISQRPVSHTGFRGRRGERSSRRFRFHHPNATSVSFAATDVVSLGRFTTMAQRARLNIAFEYM
jgi:hypothetical protein